MNDQERSALLAAVQAARAHYRQRAQAFADGFVALDLELQHVLDPKAHAPREYVEIAFDLAYDLTGNVDALEQVAALVGFKPTEHEGHS